MRDGVATAGYDLRVRILHVESGRHLYGGARQAGHLIARLTRRGVENVLVCPPEQPLAALPLGSRAITLPMAGDLDLALAPRLRRVIDAVGPDVVHVHSRRGADLFGGLASRASGRPAIVTRRVDATEPVVWARLKYRPYARIVAISRAVRRELCERIGLASARVPLVPSAVDTDRFRPDPAAAAEIRRRFALPADAFVVGIVAQMIPRKGQSFLLDCLPLLVARRPDLKLLMLGRGPDRPALARRIAARGLAARVVVGGFVTDLERVLPGLDLLAHPATREGLGSVILEAMSAGVAVVAAEAGGIGDLIADGVDGRLLPPQAASAWVETIAELAEDGPARARLGAAARARVERDFTIDAMTDAYLEIYRDVAA